jgi:hypothetical protein
MYSSSVASRTKQCPRVAAVACKKAMKASVEDCYDFTQAQEVESPFVPMKRVIQMNGSSIKVEIKVPNSRYSLRSR